MRFHLKIWRQESRDAPGGMVSYEVDGVSEDMSFLEMLDLLNEKLVAQGQRVVAFDHDCREGICGQCGLWIDGVAHGRVPKITTCQLHMRSFTDGATIHIEPWRSRAFPVVQDLVVDRSAFDRIIEAGGYVSINTGTAPEANSLPIGKESAEAAFDAAACIGCGACVAACKNSSAMLFVGAKVSHLAELPQGRVEARRRVQDMVAQMDAEGFGNCSNTRACEAVCPKSLTLDHIARMNWELTKSRLLRR
ncbi:MAG: succinate dehydrogenase/fumarate reductase iron-sulfur subunit [Myxococcota bacterium]